MPRVLIAGEDIPGSVGISFADAFRSLGWTVDYFPLSAAGATHSGLLARARARLASRIDEATVDRRLAAEAQRLNPDLSLVIKGHRLSAETISTMRRASSRGVANFYPDDPFSAAAVNRVSIEALREYSSCFIFAEHLLPAYKSAGVKQAHYLPFARDPGLHAPPQDPKPEFDAVFVGNLDRDRVAWLESIADYKLAVFGHQTKSAIPPRSRLNEARFFRPVFGRDLAEALGRGRVSLNFMRRQNSGSHNMRSFESPACGAFTLSQRTPELTQLFADGVEIDTFATTQELRDRLAGSLSDPGRRRRIADNGFRRVEHDTYARRAETILSHMV
ncbi:MAG: glycosyltransferase [Gemmatimonadales bacterium]